MKRTSLTTAVIAGIAGVAGISNMASAVYLNTDGLGSVLIYPYYTVNQDNQTLLSVVNTTSLGKAVKVRFLEAYDSKEVLDFNLYMSPYDVWVADVIPSGAGGAALFTPDNSCTVPTVPNTPSAPALFKTDALSDGGPTDISRTLEGYVELIEMGSVVSGGSGTGATGTNTLGALTHSNGIPPGCAQLFNAWSTGGYWLSDTGGDPTLHLSSPTGGLFGSGTIIDVANGTVEGYNAEAIDEFYVAGDAPAHTQPGDILPNLNTGTSYISYVFQNGTLTVSDYSATALSGADAVSSLFMAEQIFNEYTVDTSIGASTEWVVTFPTKHFYVDPNLTTVIAPFDVLFLETVKDTPDSASSCAPIAITYWDREEKTLGSAKSGPVFSPPTTTTVPGAALCYETQVVTFSQTAPSTILGSNFVANIPLASGYSSGWALLDFTKATNSSGAIIPEAQHQLSASAEGNVYAGLPAVGFAVTEYVNGTLSGGSVLANYTSLYRHKLSRSLTVVAP